VSVRLGGLILYCDRFVLWRWSLLTVPFRHPKRRVVGGKYFDEQQECRFYSSFFLPYLRRPLRSGRVAPHESYCMAISSTTTLTLKAIWF
jgi:hypothetical protein